MHVYIVECMMYLIAQLMEVILWFFHVNSKDNKYFEWP